MGIACEVNERRITDLIGDTLNKMATGSDILSYKGDANLAFGSTALPSVSTDVVVDLTPGIRAWSEYAANKLLVAREQEAALRRKQLQTQKDLEDVLNRGNYEFWEKDQPFASKSWDEFSRLVVDVAKKGNWNNINDPDFLKARAMQNDLLEQAKYSMQQRAHYKVGEDELTKHPFNYDSASQESLNAYAAAKSPKERAAMDYTLDPNITLDFDAYATKLKGSLAFQEEIEFHMENGRWRETKALIYDEEDIKKSVQLDYRTNKKLKASMDEAFADLVTKDPQYAQQVGSAEGYATQIAIDKIMGGSRQAIKNPFILPSDIRNPQAAVTEQYNFKVNYAFPAEGYKVFQMKKGDTVTGYVVKDASGKTITFPKATVGGKEQQNVSSFSSREDAERAQRTSSGVQTGSVYRAFLLSKTAEFPSNILMNTPQLAYDALTNAQLTPDEIGTDAWTIDVPSIEDIRTNKTNGKLLLEEGYNDLPDAQKKNYELRRYAIVKKANGATYRIPYDNNIKIPLTNALTAAKVPFDLPPLEVEESVEVESNSQPPKTTVPSATRAEWKAAGWTDAQIDQAVKLKKIEVK